MFEKDLAAELFNTVFEQDAYGMALRSVDPEKPFWLDANNKFCEIFGYTRDEILQLTSLDISYPEEQDEAIERNRRLLRGEIKSYSREKRYIHKDGHVVWTNIWLSAVYGEDDKPNMIISVIEDISERKKNEAALLESEERFRSFIDASPSAILLKDVRGRNLLANQVWHQWFNPERRSISEKTVADFFPEKHAQEIAAQEQQVLSSGVSIEQEHETPLANGEIKRTLLQKFPVRDASGSIVGIGGINTDLTEQKQTEEMLRRARAELEIKVEERTLELRKEIEDRKQAEEALTESEGQFRAILGTSPIGVGISRLSDGRVEYLNGRVLELSGITHLDEIRNSMREFWADVQDREAFVEAFRRDGMVSREVRLKKKDGTEYWAALTWVPAPNNEDHTLFWVYDISEMKTVQGNLAMARDTAEAASQAKTEFLSSMSHELRTPLNSVLGFGQLLIEDEDFPLNEDQTDSVGHILRAGKHLLTLINEVLDLSSIEEGNLDLSIEEVTLQPLMEESLKLVSRQAAEAGITIDLAPLENIVVLADHNRLRQVILNLVSNAIKYNRPNGHVRLSADLSIRGMASLSVSDTGPGIAEDDLADLFQPFNRLGYENSAVEGTGVGLVITRKLVEAMNGSVGVHSEVDTGSTFTIHLPVSQHRGSDIDHPTGENIRATNGSAGQPVSQDSKTILYIEDNPANQIVMKKLIGRLAEFDLLISVDAESGLEVAKQKRPDLILMDINLPGMSGLEALDELKKIPGISGTPVIAVSANAMLHDVSGGMKAGFVDYLTKPFEIDVVIAAIRKATIHSHS